MAIKGAWSRSKCTARLLLPYIAAGLIPAKAENRWRIPSGETEPAPNPGEFIVFLSFLDRGLSFPTSLFFRRLLAFYNISISDLGPHSIQQIAIFVAFCESYLGCPPYFPLWLSIFHGRASREGKGEDSPLIASGGITFQVQGGEGFIDLELPKKAQSEWRKFWFYMKEATPEGELAIPEHSPERSQPCRLWVKKLPKEQAQIVKEMRARLRSLKIAGLSTVNLYNCWLARRLAPLRSRSHWMYQYTGQNDSTRSTASEWDEAEYKKALGKITEAGFTSYAEGLQPYEPEENPAPTVSCL